MEDRTGEIGNLPPQQPTPTLDERMMAIARALSPFSAEQVDGIEVEHVLHEALDELERLRAWKAEALAVLSEWDKAFVAAGRPGPLGGSMAVATTRHIEAQEARIAEMAKAIQSMSADAWFAHLDENDLRAMLGHALEVTKDTMDRDCVFCADIGRTLGLDLTNQFDELPDPPTTTTGDDHA